MLISFFADDSISVNGRIIEDVPKDAVFSIEEYGDSPSESNPDGTLFRLLHLEIPDGHY